MGIPVLLAFVALVLAFIHELQAGGRDLLGWAVVFLALALVWGRLA